VKSEGHYASEGRSGCESIDGADEEPERIGNECCYVVDVSGPGLLGCGRPLLHEGRARFAPARRGAGWSAGGLAVDRSGLSPATAERLGRAWLRDALAEHASVASFARFALELMALAAPAELVQAAHRAALDEVVHARLCFALAESYLGAPLAPGPIDLGGAVAVSSDACEVAERLAREGCVGETLSAMDLGERLRQARDPAVRRVLAVLARDETRHAELAWRALAWLVRTGDAAVIDAVTRVAGEPPADEAMQAGWREVILPCFALFGCQPSGAV
jgi:hypothetical protein